jgi:drug/metabolite transporter (DMT)-like permease
VITAMVALGVIDLAAMAAYTAACSTGALSLVAVLASLYPAVTVLLARGLHQEHLRSVQKWGVIATLGGAALIAG